MRTPACLLLLLVLGCNRERKTETFPPVEQTGAGPSGGEGVVNGNQANGAGGAQGPGPNPTSGGFGGAGATPMGAGGTFVVGNGGNSFAVGGFGGD